MIRPILKADGLTRRYPARGLSGAGGQIRAVRDVCFEVHPGEALAIVGESGSGKSTLARLLLALERPDAGMVRFDGEPISHLRQSQVRGLRRRFQPVFQDPVQSLNPRLTVATIVAEPLAAHAMGTMSERRQRVAELLTMVGLPADAARRRPGAFSGGERQRIAIARALATGPELLILDEPVSCLDASVQGRILQLIAGLRARLHLSVVLISHDLTVVHRLCERLAVMLAGTFVETGPTEAVLDRPMHPYTRDLLRCRPVADPDWQPPESRQGSAREPSTDTGCPFLDRCVEAGERCIQAPPITSVATGRRVACWNVQGDLEP